MKFQTTILPLLCATLASSRSLVSSSLETSLNPSFPVPGDSPLTFCTNPNDYLGHIDYVNLSPNPPIPGQKLTITAEGNLDKDVGEGTKVQIRVKYNKYITIINQVYDLCENLGKIDLECPLKKGHIKIEREADIPSLVPPGNYEVFANVITEDQEQVVCMEASIAFHRA